MLNYSNQQPAVLFDGVTLSGTYADNQKELEVKGFSKISLDIDYARGAAEASSTLNFKIEHSVDGTNWHSLVIDDTSTDSTITPRVWVVGTTNKLNILVDIAYSKIRVSAVETGVVTNAGSLSMTALLSGL